MKCLTKYKCIPYAQNTSNYSNNFTCIGRPKIPSKFKNDVVRLCLAGKHTQRYVDKHFWIEMTPEEAISMVSLILLRVHKWIKYETKIKMQ